MGKLCVLLCLALLAPFANAAAAGPIINGQGTAILTWTAPTLNEDGTPFLASDTAGFVIFWGPQSRFDSAGVLRTGCTDRPLSRASQGCYASVLDLTDGTARTSTLTIPLTAGATLSFALTAVSKTTGWSRYSNEVSKVFTLTTTSTAPPVAPVVQSVTMTFTCTTNVATVTCTIQ